MKSRNFNVIMLAGGLRDSPLYEQLGIHTLALPLGRHASVLAAWLAALAPIAGCRKVVIVVSSEEDASRLSQLVVQHQAGVRQTPTTTVIREPNRWRGTGGLLRDVAAHLDGADPICVIESTCLPPPSLPPALFELNEDACGFVASTRSGEPAGICVLKHSALETVPATGYFDMKEQLFPRLHKQERQLRSLVIGEALYRMRDRAGYLSALRALLVDGGQQATPHHPSGAHVSPGARILGCSVIEAQCVIEEGAVVHDSVVFGGTVVGAGAVVSRSLIGPGNTIARGTTTVDEVVRVESRTKQHRPAGDDTPRVSVAHHTSRVNAGN